MVNLVKNEAMVSTSAYVEYAELVLSCPFGSFASYWVLITVAKVSHPIFTVKKVYQFSNKSGVSLSPSLSIGALIPRADCFL